MILQSQEQLEMADLWVSYADAKATFGELPVNAGRGNGKYKLHISINGIEIPANELGNMDEVVKKINDYTTQTGVRATAIDGKNFN